MAFKPPIQLTPEPPIAEKIGKTAFHLMVGCIVMYHGIDSARKLYVMGSEAGKKIGSYFNKKKEEIEAEKAANIK